MSASCGCMDTWLNFLRLILLTRFSQRRSLVSGEGQRDDFPCALWLQQVDRHLKEMGMGQASAWGMARRKPLEYRRKVDAATRCSGTCSHT